MAMSTASATQKAGRTPPTLRGHWLGGCVGRLWRDPIGLYTEAWQKHGDCVRLRLLPGIHSYLVTHPDALEHILQKNHKNYRKPDLLIRPMRLLVGNGLFTSEGA